MGYFDSSYFDPAYFGSVYFDCPYFDPVYFDCGVTPSVTSGHPHGFPRAWDRRNIQMPPAPIWAELAVRKRRRIEDETWAAILRAQAEARRRRTIHLALGFEVHP